MNNLIEKPLIPNSIATPVVDSDNAPLSIGPELGQTVGRTLGYYYEFILGI
jgi:hypothetical protein